MTRSSEQLSIRDFADPSVWERIGYRPFPVDVSPTPTAALALTSFNEIRAKYDVVVIGSGAGGGVAAMVLAEAGASVLIVERGNWLDRETIGVDYLRNHRLESFGDSTSPVGHPRAVEVDGVDVAVEQDDRRYQNNAITVGGGTRLFGAQAWRFLPEDFTMASIYGVPDGSVLADWPIGYDELAPYYDLVEQQIGVSGAVSHPEEPLAGRSYPMPPLRAPREAQLLRAAAAQLGWNTGTVPMLINSVARDGRAGCANCGYCVGFACPVEAKNGTQVTALPRALRAGAHLVTATQATRISDNGVVELWSKGARKTVSAGQIVVAAGAIETARLLLLSGLGNDWVGDCLQGHTYSGALGVFDEEIWDGVGPGPSISTRRFSHAPTGMLGGGLLANDFVKIPTVFAAWGREPGTPLTIDAVAGAYRRTMHVVGPVQELPVRSARVRVSASVGDAAGVPVAQLSGRQHEHDLVAGAFMASRAEEWIAAAGAKRTWQSKRMQQELSAGQHQAGTARMSDDPHYGATDPYGKVWGTDRVWVADASVHVTNGGCNPVLTIMALAWRTAQRIC